MLWVWGAILAGVGYLLGTVLHELSHVVVVVATETPLNGVSVRHTTVFYDPGSERVDWLVRAAPVALTPLVVLAMVWAVNGIWSGVFAVGILGGFVPRDLYEYRAVVNLFSLGVDT